MFDQWFTQKSVQLFQSICPTLRETEIHSSLRLCPALALQRLALNPTMDLIFNSLIGSLSLISGLLPRVKGDVAPLRTVPSDRKPNPWRPKDALFGQNDYIDILGDGSINPTQLMTSTPHWLKNFRGNEMQMLIRRRTAFRYWQWCRPKKWTELNLRIDRLYRKLNYKTPPPRPRYP